LRGIPIFFLFLNEGRGLSSEPAMGSFGKDATRKRAKLLRVSGGAGISCQCTPRITIDRSARRRLGRREDDEGIEDRSPIIVTPPEVVMGRSFRKLKQKKGGGKRDGGKGNRSSRRA